MLSIIVAIWAVVILSSLAALLFFVFKKPIGENRFGPAPRKLTFIGCILSGYRRAFDFSGRSSRAELFYFVPVAAVLLLATWAGPTYLLYNLVYVSQIYELQPFYFYLWPTTIAFWAAINTLAAMAVAIRRLHDINRGGGWVLITPGLGAILLMFWFTRPTQPRGGIRSLDIGIPLSQRQG